MDGYFAIDNCIYSFSMTTYVFPIWQTYFFLLIYANNIWKFTQYIQSNPLNLMHYSVIRVL